MHALSTLAGLLLGIVIIAVAIGMTSVSPAHFLNLPSLVFVIGGTFAATLASYPLSGITHAVHTLSQSFSSRQGDTIKAMVRHYADFIALLKKGNIQEIEAAARKIRNPYLETAAQMLHDGAVQEDIMRVLKWRLDRVRAEDRNASNVFRTMSAFAPAFGMMGTILGLVNMLDMMDSGDFNTIGMNMALALITTFYGLILANMIFKPCATKIDQKQHEDIVMMNLAREAVLLLSANSKNPAYARDILNKLIESQMDTAHAKT